MHSEPTVDEVAEATVAMKSRITKFILETSESKTREAVTADFRTVTLLQSNGVFKRRQAVRVKGISASSFKTLSSGISSGPLLFFVQNNGKSMQVHPASALILDSRRSVRRAILKNILKLGGMHRVISGSTLKIVVNHAADIESSAASVWQPASVVIADAIEHDLLLSIAGLRQSLEARLDNAYADYFAKVIRPSYEALDAFEPPILSASSQATEIERRIQALVKDAKDWQDALSQYWRIYGCVALSEPLSISRLYREWRATQRLLPVNLFQDLWKWADDSLSPLARYHVCYLLVSFPDIVPVEQFPRLWTEIAQIIHVPRESSADYPMTLAWQVRCDLARHYTQHIEVRVPGQSSELVSLCAWAIAEAVASLYPSGDEGLRQLREETIVPFDHQSSSIWQVVMPLLRVHPLRYATLFTRSMWSLSMLCHLGRSLARLSPASIADTDRSRIEAELTVALLSVFPGRPNPSSAYEFEESPVQTAEAWAAVGLDRGAKYEEISSICQKVIRWEDNPSPLESLGKGREADDVLIVHALRVSAYLGQAPVDRLFEMFQDDKWRDELLLGGSDNRFEVIADALLQISSLALGKWSLQLPHYFAIACEKSGSDPSRRKALFTCAVMAAVASDTTSALERLARGPCRKELTEDIREWRIRLERMQLGASAWAASKMRPALVALHL